MIITQLMELRRNHINKKERRALVSLDCVLKKLLVVYVDSDSVKKDRVVRKGCDLFILAQKIKKYCCITDLFVFAFALACMLFATLYIMNLLYSYFKLNNFQVLLFLFVLTIVLIS